MGYKWNGSLAKTVDVYEKWWKGELDRPLVPAFISGYDPDRPKPACYPPDAGTIGCSQLLFANTGVSVKECVDCIEYALSGLEFLGDYYPMINTDFSGPGILAAFLGAKLTTSNHGIWFFSEKQTELADIHLEYDPDNYWLVRMKEIILECKKRFGSDVVLGIPDIGGAIDVLASLRGTNKLLYDFVESPEEVKRLMDEISALWKVYFSDMAALYSKENYYSNWGKILCKESTYMFQADFTYMIGPDMFDEFIMPELESNFSFVKRAFYHLDGKGQLSHLDALLNSRHLRGIQWVPGEGSSSPNLWIDVHNKILDSGKLLQVCDYPAEKYFDSIIQSRGSLKGVTSYVLGYDKKDRDKALRLLDTYRG